MLEILELCAYLGILVVINILCSVYYNIKVADIKFDKQKLLSGIFKASIVAISFVGLSFVFNQLPQLADAVGVEPKAIMMSAIILYAGLAIKSLADILKVKVVEKEEDKKQ